LTREWARLALVDAIFDFLKDELDELDEVEEMDF
jgi:hypothetical protein